MLCLNGIKCKDKLCAESPLRSGLKGSGIFVIILSQDDFESDFPETELQKIIF